MTILAHMAMNRWQTKQGGMDGGKQTERGQEHEKGSGHGRQRMAAGTQPAEQGNCRRTQPEDSPLGSGLKQTATDDRPRS